MSLHSHRRPPQGKRRKANRVRIRVTAVAASLALAAVPASAPTWRGTSAQADAASHTPGVVPAARFTWRGSSAREVLRRVIEGLEHTATAEKADPYTYFHVRSWPAEGRRSTAVADVHRWLRSDGFGTQRSSVVATDESLAVTASPAHTTTQTGPPVEMTAPATRPEALGGQLHHYASTLHMRLAEVITLIHSRFCLNTGQRAALLQVLADTDDVQYLGRFADRGGRQGTVIAIPGQASDGADVLDILIFAESDGALLSHELQASEPTALVSYTRYLECGKASDPGAVR